MEKGLRNVELDILRTSYTEWLSRSYLGNIAPYYKDNDWKRELKKLNIDIRCLGGVIWYALGCVVKDEEDWEFISPETFNSYVYLIRNTNTGSIKIGLSKNPTKRLKQLQTGNESQLDLIGVCKPAGDVFELENLLHNLYSKYNIRGSEWFSINDLELTNIQGMFHTQQDP